MPYGASNLNNTANGVNPRPFVTNPGYITPPTGSNTIYFFTARDAYRTDGQKRTDLALNYTYRHDTFAQPRCSRQLAVMNIFDNSQLCGCGGTHLLERRRRDPDPHRHRGAHQRVTNPTLYATFNPFTTTPVEGVNWAKGPAFGTALNRFAYTSPRQLRLSFGVRF